MSSTEVVNQQEQIYTLSLVVGWVTTIYLILTNFHVSHLTPKTQCQRQ